MTAQTTAWATRDPEAGAEALKTSLLGSVVLHALVAAALVGSALLLHRNGESWGGHEVTTGAIQATMVSSLPLPPRQKLNDAGVLTFERTSVAPAPAKERAEPPPTAKEIPVPAKQPPKPPKVAERPVPETVKHPQPTPPTPKATTGETSGIRIAQSTLQMKNGTASVSVEDRNFGARFAYYVNIVNRTVAQNWYTQEADPVASQGKRVTIVFDIDRDGLPSNARIEQRSGSPSLDTSALRALQRVEGFGPLPAGNRITVEYSFDYRRQ